MALNRRIVLDDADINALPDDPVLTVEPKRIMLGDRSYSPEEFDALRAMARSMAIHQPFPAQASNVAVNVFSNPVVDHAPVTQRNVTAASFEENLSRGIDNLDPSAMNFRDYADYCQSVEFSFDELADEHFRNLNRLHMQEEATRLWGTVYIPPPENAL